jgi:dGTPase
MTEDWRKVFDHYKDDPQQRKRTVCDFIAGMTNRNCLEFYQRLFGVQPPSIHKP